MQILGKRSRILLIAVAVFMLTALGLSFALWDTSAVKASSGDLSQYANAKVGDVITFGQYYQTGNKDKNDPTEYEKTPIEWLVVDKDERSGEITLMSKYILANGNYFGNWYYNSAGTAGYYYDADNTEVAGIPYNQAYVESTARAFLNNLERLDMGGDGFTSGIGYVPSATNSSIESGLLSSVGFSNQRYWTGLYTSTAEDKALVDDGTKGLSKRYESSNTEIYYQRPIKNDEYKNRPATRGFFDEAFSENEKSIIAPKKIAGYTGHRWPDNAHDISTKSYIEGAYDKVWLPSAIELNIMNGIDWNEQGEDAWTNPSDEAGSAVFEYFKQFADKASLTNAVKATRTPFAENGFAMNYSIPLYNKLAAGTTEVTVNTDISKSANLSDYYWTRSPMSYWCDAVRVIRNSGRFSASTTDQSYIGVRPCIVIKY